MMSLDMKLVFLIIVASAAAIVKGGHQHHNHPHHRHHHHRHHPKHLLGTLTKSAHRHNARKSHVAVPTETRPRSVIQKTADDDSEKDLVLTDTGQVNFDQDTIKESSNILQRITFDDKLPDDFSSKDESRLEVPDTSNLVHIDASDLNLDKGKVHIDKEVDEGFTMDKMIDEGDDESEKDLSQNKDSDMAEIVSKPDTEGPDVESNIEKDLQRQLEEMKFKQEEKAREEAEQLVESQMKLKEKGVTGPAELTALLSKGGKNLYGTAIEGVMKPAYKNHHRLTPIQTAMKLPLPLKESGVKNAQSIEKALGLNDYEKAASEAKAIDLSISKNLTMAPTAPSRDTNEPTTALDLSSTTMPLTHKDKNGSMKGKTDTLDISINLGLQSPKSKPAPPIPAPFFNTTHSDRFSTNQNAAPTPTSQHTSESVIVGSAYLMSTKTTEKQSVKSPDLPKNNPPLLKLKDASAKLPNEVVHEDTESTALDSKLKSDSSEYLPSTIQSSMAKKGNESEIIQQHVYSNHVKEDWEHITPPKPTVSEGASTNEHEEPNMTYQMPPYPHLPTVRSSTVSAQIALQEILEGPTYAQQTQEELPHQNFCRHKPDGSYVHPDTFDKYIECIGGQTIHRDCPKGSKYNEETKICDKR